MTKMPFPILGAVSIGALAVAASGSALAANLDKTKHELAQLEQAWCAASVKADASALAAILSDDYQDVILTGDVEDKSQTLADLKTDKTTQCKTDALQIRVYGDAAVVIGRTRWDAAAFHGSYRFTDVYIRRASRWECVTSQATELKGS